jgi:DNA-binding response OmpR family regulator
MSLVLVVEDDTAILRGLQESLRLEHHDVLCASDGETGYQLAMGKKTGSCHPRLDSSPDGRL